MAEHPAEAFLTAAHGRAELWATEASRKDDHPVVDGGEHWHWECSGHDHEAVPQPGLDEHLSTGQCECWTMSLRSREEYPSRFGSGMVPHILFRSEEMPPAVAGHIVLHDPAAALRRVAAERELLAEHANTNDGDCAACVVGQWGYPTHGGCSPAPWPCRTVLLIAEGWGWEEERNGC